MLFYRKQQHITTNLDIMCLLFSLLSKDHAHFSRRHMLKKKGTGLRLPSGVDPVPSDIFCQRCSFLLRL